MGGEAFQKFEGEPVVPIEVISNLIHSKPRTRLHEFSEAFSLKKKDT